MGSLRCSSLEDHPKIQQAHPSSECSPLGCSYPPSCKRTSACTANAPSLHRRIPQTDCDNLHRRKECMLSEDTTVPQVRSMFLSLDSVWQYLIIRISTRPNCRGIIGPLYNQGFFKIKDAHELSKPINNNVTYHSQLRVEICSKQTVIWFHRPESIHSLNHNTL